MGDYHRYFAELATAEAKSEVVDEPVSIVAETGNMSRSPDHATYAAVSNVVLHMETATN